MANLVIIYPRISEEDFNVIQDIRQKYDRNFTIVKPHVTLVFPTDKLTSEEIFQHVRNKLNLFKSFNITLDSAKVVEDDSKKFFHTFLVPSDGYKQINELHDLLYTDRLTSELRHDIPFIPHVGIGTSEHKEEMDALAKELNDKGLSIRGQINEVTIVEYYGSKVKDKDSVPLDET